MKSYILIKEGSMGDGFFLNKLDKLGVKYIYDRKNYPTARVILEDHYLPIEFYRIFDTDIMATVDGAFQVYVKRIF